MTGTIREARSFRWCVRHVARQLVLTRDDDGFDSIAWAFAEHVKTEDAKKYNFAILYGNADAPEEIRFWKATKPLYNTADDFVWHPK
jgi:hypothetical protein